MFHVIKDNDNVKLIYLRMIHFELNERFVTEIFVCEQKVCRILDKLSSNILANVNF